MGREKLHPSGRVMPIAVGLSPWHLQQLDELAAAYQTSRSEMVRILIERWVQ